MMGSVKCIIESITDSSNIIKFIINWKDLKIQALMFSDLLCFLTHMVFELIIKILLDI